MTGSTPATNLDNSGNIVAGPVIADRGDYNTGGRLVWALVEAFQSIKVTKPMLRSKSTCVGILTLGLLTTLSACANEAGKPSSTAPYTVSVDLFSGRENPKVELSTGVAEGIYDDLAGREKEFQASAVPSSALGFRGFVITPNSDSRPVLHVMRDSVYSVRNGRQEKLADPAGKYYDLILSDVKTKLPQEILNALP